MSTERIKKFFQRKKSEAKFKLAGPGRKLTTNQPSQPSTSSKSKDKEAYVPPRRKELSSEARAAAAAALARCEKKDVREFNTSLAAIQAQVRRELEAEKKAKLGETVSKDVIQEEKQRQNYAVQGVYFRCPLISEEILPRKDWKEKIKTFLYEQLEYERGLTACLILVNCNPKEKAEQCIETLSKYLENIINHPDEEKYRKIRMSNAIFCDKVKSCEGALDFLLAAGFVEQQIDDELYMLWKGDCDFEEMKSLLDGLKHSEIIQLELDRNIQVLMPSQAKKIELPPDFYRISPEEIKREQQLRSEALEQAQLLKTKAMREREEVRVINRYKFALIRIRFPDGVYLQGTFNVYEKLADIYEFVESCIKDEFSLFSLTAPTGHKFVLDDLDKSLYDLRLIPNTILNFSFENQEKRESYLKEEMFMLIKQM